jgi:hypothetical protein
MTSSVIRISVTCMCVCVFMLFLPFEKSDERLLLLSDDEDERPKKANICLLRACVNELSERHGKSNATALCTEVNLC